MLQAGSYQLLISTFSCVPAHHGESKEMRDSAGGIGLLKYYVQRFGCERELFIKYRGDPVRSQATRNRQNLSTRLRVEAYPIA